MEKNCINIRRHIQKSNSLDDKIFNSNQLTVSKRVINCQDIVQMKKVSCVICDTDNTEGVLVKNYFNIVKCISCGLVYINPRPSRDELKKFYSGHRNYAWNVNNRNQKTLIEKFRKGLRILNNSVQNRGKILDVGCSTGVFLNMAKDAGWETYGIDVDQRIIEYANSKYGLNVKTQDLETSNFKSKYFEAVTFFDVIEHVPDPLYSLKEVYRILKPNGFLLLTTPNIDGLIPKLTYFLFLKTIGAWEHPTPPGHLYQFSVKTIKKLLDKNGWLVIGVKKYSIPIGYTVGKLENAIIDSIKNNSGTISHRFNRSEKTTSNSDSNKHSKLNVSKKLLRLMIRCLCFVIILIASPFAALIRQGDSMLILAQKRN